MGSPSGPYARLPSQADLFYLCTTLSTSETDLSMYVGTPSKGFLSIGVLLLGEDEIQLLDLAPVDMLAMIGRGRMSKLNTPEPALEGAIEFVFHIITESGEGSCPVSSGSSISATTSFEDAPQFDVIFVPQSCSGEISDAAKDFLDAQISNPDFIALMSISSGITSLARTGLLHQKRATGPPYLLSQLQGEFPETAWQATRWSRHGPLWSSSSSMSAIDMTAAWMREYFWDRAETVYYALNAAGLPVEQEEYDDA